MELHINLIGRRDLTGEIYRQLRAAILEGRLRGGEALPPTRELAARLSVSRSTVSVAYDRLISEGFAIGKRGAGTYVAANLSPTALEPRAQSAGALQPRPVWEDVRIPTELWRVAKFDFRVGLPDVRLFPYDSWRRVLNREFRANAANGLYGRPAGHPRLRRAIAHHVAVSRGVRADADDVIVTNGAQQAIDLIARVLLAPGDCVAVEDPGYGPPRRLLKALGLCVCAVPVDGEGLIVDAIPSQTRLVYVSPSHQFPLGVSMSLPRRLALLEWARRSGAAIVEDDYDSEFRFGGRPLESLHMLDAGDRVIYVGSFSKSMLPTLRLGFVIVPPALRRATESAKHLADWHSSSPLQAAMAAFIEEGLFARHVRRMRIAYEARHRLIGEVLPQLLGSELELVRSSVGLHVSTLAKRASVEQLIDIVQRASALGVECTPLSLYAAGETRRAGLVFGYGAIAREQIQGGLQLLRDAFEART